MIEPTSEQIAAIRALTNEIVAIGDRVRVSPEIRAKSREGTVRKVEWTMLPLPRIESDPSFPVVFLSLDVLLDNGRWLRGYHIACFERIDAKEGRS